MQTSLFEIRGTPVNGERVIQARELMGLTQTALGELLSVDQTFVAHIERGTRQPSTELISSLAGISGFPESFFRQKDGITMPKGTLLFRSKAILGRRAISTHYQYCRLAVEFAIRLAEYADLLPVSIPALNDPIEAAQSVRASLEIPLGPLPNVLRSIEKLGVIVVPLREASDCSGFASWAGSSSDVPVIALASNLPFDRHRLTAAHELGHLILHRGIKSASKEVEEEAYTFASELLLPAEAIVADLREEKVSLFRLAALKNKWQVSMQAIARRARELQVISDRQYRYLMMQVAQRGWRTSEPAYGNQQAEKPRAIGKLVEIALGCSVDWTRRAPEFGLGEMFIRELLNACDYDSRPKSVTALTPAAEVQTLRPLLVK